MSKRTVPEGYAKRWRRVIPRKSLLLGIEFEPPREDPLLEIEMYIAANEHLFPKLKTSELYVLPPKMQNNSGHASFEDFV